MSLNVIASMSIAVCMGFVYNQSPRELVPLCMRITVITVASGVILMLPSLGKRTAPGLLDIGCLEAKSAPICMMLAPSMMQFCIIYILI